MRPRSRAAFDDHLARIAALGCTDLGGEWEGVIKPRKLRCPAGHEVSPVPNNIKQGQGPCWVCGGRGRPGTRTKAPAGQLVRRTDGLTVRWVRAGQDRGNKVV